MVPTERSYQKKYMCNMNNICILVPTIVDFSVHFNDFNPQIHPLHDS